MPERFWRIVDAITSLCPVCAFVRGALFGLTVASLLYVVTQ